MYEGNIVELQMKKNILENGVLDDTTYQCKVFTHVNKSEDIYLTLEQGELTDLSLDAIYECRIFTDEGVLSCEGTIQSRYQNCQGNVVQFRIENGFYKNNIK